MAKMYDDGLDGRNERRVKLGYPPIKRNANKSYDKLGREINYIDGKWQTYDDGGYYIVADSCIPNSVKNKINKKEGVKKMAKNDEKKGKKGFSMKEKRAHYNEIAFGNKDVKANSKFSMVEQKAYARGQADARNESVRLYAYKNSSPEERLSYAAKKAQRKADRLAQKAAAAKANK